MSAPLLLSPELVDAARVSPAWPFEEARKLVKRVEASGQKERAVRDRLRPVRPAAYRHLRRGRPHQHGAPRLRSPDRGQDRDAAPRLLRRHGRAAQGPRQRSQQGTASQRNLGKPLTQVPDPFGTHASFGAHNNARLRAFLDHFGFDYEFASSTEYYKSGRFDDALLQMLARYDAVMKIMLPTLREERAAPIRPSCPSIPRPASSCRSRSTRYDAEAGTIVWPDPDTGEHFEHAGDRRPLQAAMEARLGDALVCARRRLRDGRQGPHRLGEALGRHRAGARRRAAGRLQLRTLPRREGPEDLEVEGQRPDDRGMADLRQPREPVAVHVPEADARRSGSTST